MRAFALGLVALGAVACAPQPGDNFVGSNRSAVELRAIQSRTVDGSPEAVGRVVVTTLHDLGYRITRVDAGSGTVSATKADQLRLAAVVRGQADNRTVVRANAVVAMPDGRAYEVDAPEFYRQNFFAPLAAALGREMAEVGGAQAVPDAARPVDDSRPANANQPATGANTPATEPAR